MKIAIKDLGEIITGNTPSKKEESFWDSDDICFVKPDIIEDNGVTLIKGSNEYLSESAREKARIVSKDAVFVTCIGIIGKIGIASEGIYAFNQQINVIVPNEKVMPRYLAYNLLFSKSRLEAISNAPVVPIINKTQFGEFTVNIENSIDKQIKIVSILDKLSEIICSRKDELKELDNLIKARFVEMFGDPVLNDKNWNITTLLGSLQDGRTVTYGIVQTGDDVEGGVPVFRPIDIAGGNVPKRESLKRTLPEISAKYQRTLLSGTELLVTVRGSIGETFQISNVFKGCNVGRNIVPLVTDDRLVNQRYLQELFAQEPIKRWLKGITKGIALQGLNMSEFKDMPVIVPPMDMQKSFVAFVEQVDKSKSVIQQSLEETHLLFDSLMQEYFG